AGEAARHAAGVPRQAPAVQAERPVLHAGRAGPQRRADRPGRRLAPEHRHRLRRGGAGARCDRAGARRAARARGRHAHGGPLGDRSGARSPQPVPRAGARQVKRAIEKHAKDFAFVVGIFLVALGVGAFILSHQRLYLPHWVPVAGSDFVDRKMELATAQALTPGQGQEIAIAGVKVGEIAKVELREGRALVTVKIRRKYDKRIRRDASALIRPKTGLNDMAIQLNPGSPRSPRLPDNEPIPVSQVVPTVNADEIFASLDRDTRDYLRMLLSGAGQGLHDNSRELSNTFRRFEPVGRDLARFTRLLQDRHANIAHSIHNFRLLAEALGEKDTQLTRLVDSSNQVFQTFAREDADLRSTLRQLPPTLRVTRSGLAKGGRFARALGPAAGKLRPFARDLAPALRAQRPFVKTATPIIRDSVRPFPR